MCPSRLFSSPPPPSSPHPLTQYCNRLHGGIGALQEAGLHTSALAGHVDRAGDVFPGGEAPGESPVGDGGGRILGGRMGGWEGGRVGLEECRSRIGVD